MVAKKRTPIPEDAVPEKSIDDLFGDDEEEIEVAEEEDEIPTSNNEVNNSESKQEDIGEGKNTSGREKKVTKNSGNEKKNTHGTSKGTEGLLGSGIPNKAQIAEIKSEVSDRLSMLEKTGSMEMYLGSSLDLIDDDGTQGIQLGNYSAGVLSRMKVMLQEARVLKKHKLSANAINGAMIEYVLDEIRTKKGKSKFLNDFVLKQKLDSLNTDK